ncbi:MAG: Shedu immune nuclease family protein [Daejeonella sp.]
MPNQPFTEIASSENSKGRIFHFTDANGKPVHKTKEIYPAEKRFVYYPFSINRKLDQINPKKLKCIEFKGWNTEKSLPKDFKKTPTYDFSTYRAKQFFSMLKRKLPKIEKIIFTINSPTKLSEKTASFNWGDFEHILRSINKEKVIADKSRKALTTNLIAEISSKVKRNERVLSGGELEYFLGKFDSFEKISAKDIDSLTKILSDLPVSKITTTNHVIRAKEKIDIIYLEDIIAEFEDLLKKSEDDEESWQKFFQKNTWTLNHLFPFEVILSKGKAYVGGKTFENDDGRIVDFLFETGFKDNFALLEIKTPKKQLLKNTAYRSPAVFSVSDELSGGVNQCLDQKDIFMRDLGQKQKSLDPKLILVVGTKSKLSPEQKNCFELYRANQKNVDIVTFDELHSKMKGLLSVITNKKRK